MTTAASTSGLFVGDSVGTTDRVAARTTPPVQVQLGTRTALQLLRKARR